MKAISIVGSAERTETHGVRTKKLLLEEWSEAANLAKGGRSK